jgi:hypothetical protein
LSYLALVLTLAFLTICGGDGSSFDKGKISLELIDFSFPAFNDVDFTVTSIKSNIEYFFVSEDEIRRFKDNILNKRFCYNDNARRYERSYVEDGILVEAIAKIADDSDINLCITTSGSITHNSALYKSVFDFVDVDIAYIQIAKFYNESMTSMSNAYANSLKSRGFKCSFVHNTWECFKSSGKIIYLWMAYPDSSYEWRVYLN